MVLDYFVASEIKSVSSFLSARFHIGDYEIRNRRDKDKGGCWVNEFVKNGIITKRLRDLETKPSGTICTEIAISKKKWFFESLHRPPSSSNIDISFLTS